jgi:hypothetical protein
LPLTPHAGIVSGSWRRVPSLVARRGQQIPLMGLYEVRHHSVGLLNAVSDVSSRHGLSRPRQVASGHACSLPSVKSLTPGFVPSHQ